jgi:Flp pilus assembly protein TadD
LHRLDGEYERALRSYDRLVRLDPAAHVVASCNRALIFIFRGHFDEARRELEQASKSEPNNPLVKTFRALTLYYLGNIREATDLMQEVVRGHPNMQGVRPFLAMFLSAQGRHEEARRELTEQVRNNALVDPDIAYGVASVHALEGDADEAFKWLERSIALGNENRTCFEHDPNLERLRRDPRFQELMSNLTARRQV